MQEFISWETKPGILIAGRKFNSRQSLGQLRAKSLRLGQSCINCSIVWP